MLTMRSGCCLAKSALRYATKGTSGSSLLERAVTSEWSVMSSCQGDCRCNSLRMDLAYSLHGLKSRPKECKSTTLLAPAAAAPHANNIVKTKNNPRERYTREAFPLECRLGRCTTT